MCDNVECYLDIIYIYILLRPSGIDVKYYYWCPASNVCLYVTICNVPRTAHYLYIPYTIIYYIYVSIVCNLVIRRYIVMFT